MYDDGPNLYPRYERLLRNGEYDSVEEMCNALGLNYDDVYDYDEYSERLEREEESTTDYTTDSVTRGRSRSRRRRKH